MNEQHRERVDRVTASLHELAARVSKRVDAAEAIKSQAEAAEQDDEQRVASLEAGLAALQSIVPAQE